MTFTIRDKAGGHIEINTQFPTYEKPGQYGESSQAEAHLIPRESHALLLFRDISTFFYNSKEKKQFGIVEKRRYYPYELSLAFLCICFHCRSPPFRSFAIKTNDKKWRMANYAKAKQLLFTCAA